MSSDHPPVAVTINGQAQQLDSTPDRTLLEVLREDLGLLGTRNGCGEGECGACAVLVDGLPFASCRSHVTEVEGKSITTIEGLANGETLHPVQQVFLDENAFQCGFCTSGMIVCVVGHLNANPDLSDESLLKKMDANLCRCCGYAKVGPAITKAAAAVRAAKETT